MIEPRDEMHEITERGAEDALDREIADRAAMAKEQTLEHRILQLVRGGCKRANQLYDAQLELTQAMKVREQIRSRLAEIQAMFSLHESQEAASYLKLREDTDGAMYVTRLEEATQRVGQIKAEIERLSNINRWRRLEAEYYIAIVSNLGE
jgi:hypothetical protein